MDQIGIVVIGCGGWGRHLVRNLHEMGLLVGVVEPTDGGRETARRIGVNCPIDVPLESFLRRPDVHAVVVATPAETHFDLAMASLQAGKDVFVEKPLALSVSHAASLLRIARERGRILMVGHLLQYHPAFVRLREMARSGELGTVRSAWLTRMSPGRIRRQENVWWSFAPHDVSAVLALFGERPSEVSCTGRAFVQPGIVDSATCTLSMPGGGWAHVAVSWIHPEKHQRMIVVGSDRGGLFDDVRTEGKLQLADVHVKDGPNGPEVVRAAFAPVPVASGEPLRLECEQFTNAVRTRTPPYSDGEEGLAVVAVLAAAQRSLEGRGVPVEVEYE